MCKRFRVFKKYIWIIPLIIFMQGCATFSPGPSYRQEYTLTNPMPELTINISPVGSAWVFEITNNTDDIIKFLIDDSSYVTTDGKAERLIRGKARVIHSDSIQPSLPIPPNAMFKDFIITEGNASVGSVAFYYAARPANPDALAKFYLVFEINGKKKTAIYDVKFVKEK